MPLSVRVGGLLSTNSDELQMASSALRQTIRDSRARIGEMESRLESSRTELEAARGSSAVLEEQLDGLRAIAAQRAQALEAAEASFRAKEEEIARGLREKSGELDLMNAVVEDLRTTVREEQALREEAERALAEEAALREEAEKKMAEMDKIIERMEYKADEKARLLEAQGERFEKLSSELKDLVAQAESELARESIDRQKAQDELAEMKAAKEEILLQTEALRSESAKAETEAETLRSGLAASQKAAVEKAREQEQELKRLRGELEAALKASDGKAGEFSTLESRLRKAQAESAERESRLQSMETQVQQASSESSAKEEQLKGLQVEVDRLEENIAAVQAAAAEEEQKMVREVQRLGKVVETELKASSGGNRSGELAAMQKQMAEQEKRAEQLELEVQEAEAQAATKESEIEALQASVTALETSLEEAQASASGQAALEAELKAAQDQLESQQTELDAAAERCATLDSSVDSALVPPLESALAEREQQLQEMEASLQDRAALVEEVQAEAAAKEEQVRVLEESLKSAQETAEMEARDMARKIDALQGELQDAQELRALEARMSDMRDELELAESGLEEGEAEEQEEAEAAAPEAVAAEDEEASDALAAAARTAREIQSSAPTAEAPGLDVPLALRLGAFDIPHPEKGAGEDALILMPEIDAFAVADGVSGWAEDGVDPAIYPKEIMNGVQAGFESSEISSTGLPGILDYAYSSNEEVGSCTVCVAQLEEGRSLKVANLGDSGLKVLRREPAGAWQVAWESGSQQHEFNMPYQMSSDKEYSDTAQDADYSTVPVNPGDVIVQATDGLWDNLRDQDMCQIVAGVPRTGGIDVDALAEYLCAAASRNSVDTSYPSPFMQEAVRAGQIQVSIFDKMQGIEPTGGKLDDITVVVAEVTGSAA